MILRDCSMGFFNGGLLIVILMVFLRDCHGYFLGHYGIYWDSGSKVGGAVKLYTSVYRYTLLITKKIIIIYIYIYIT